MLPPLVSPAMKDAKPVRPLALAAGVSVNVLSKPRFPRGDAGWKIVNSSRRISVPYFQICRPRTQVRFSESVYEFCSSFEGKKVGLPRVATSLNESCGNPPMPGENGTP